MLYRRWTNFVCILSILSTLLTFVCTFVCESFTTNTTTQQPTHVRKESLARQNAFETSAWVMQYFSYINYTCVLISQVSGVFTTFFNLLIYAGSHLACQIWTAVDWLIFLVSRFRLAHFFITQHIFLTSIVRVKFKLDRRNNTVSTFFVSFQTHCPLYLELSSISRTVLYILNYPLSRTTLYLNFPLSQLPSISNNTLSWTILSLELPSISNYPLSRTTLYLELPKAAPATHSTAHPATRLTTHSTAHSTRHSIT